MPAGAQTTIASGGTLSLSGFGASLSRTLINNGAATWVGGTLSITNGTFQNNGSFTANFGGTASVTGPSGTNAFNNAGNYVQQIGAAPTFSAPFNNSGTIDLQGGSLTLAGGGTHTGDFVGNSGATLQFGGTHNFSTVAAITGAMNVGVQAGAMLNVDLNNASPRNLIVSTGAISLGGTINVRPLAGFTASEGNTIRIATAGSVNGQFSAVKGPTFNGLQFAADYGSDHVDLKLVPFVASGPLHTLRNGFGDGKVALTIDGYGSFGSAVGGGTSDATYDPIGSNAASGTVYKSGLYLRGVADGWLTGGHIGSSAALQPAFFIGGTLTAISEFTRGPLQFHVEHRLVDSFDENGVNIGSVFEQNYRITNTSEEVLNFELTRYVLHFRRSELG